MTIELCLFRHGRTTWNSQGRYQGITDVDLDELGKRQALAVAQRCVDIAPAAIFSSDLRRCADVARAASEATGVPVTHDPGLRERDVGEWSGLTHTEVKERFADDYAAWTAGDETVRPGGGESITDVVARIDAFVARVRALGPDGPVVAVTHAGWIRSVLQWMLGNDFPRRSVGVPTQGSLSVVSLMDDGSQKLEAFNDRGHLLGVENVDREPPAAPIY